MIPKPTVTLIIPCRNEEKYIGKCLNSIINQEYPKENLKVFVSDGMSKDNSKLIIQEYETKNAFIHLLENKKQTTPFGLNLGIRHSKSDIIIILGAHSEIYPDYIKNCVKFLEQENNNIAGVGGILGKYI